MDAAHVIIPNLPWIIGGALILSAAAIGGWIHTTRLRIKHGYPLEGMWGQALKPTTDAQTAERVQLLTQENAQLRAELGAVKDRLANVERIVTDSGFQLSQDFARLSEVNASAPALAAREKEYLS